jgi:hypothetical protein
MAIQAPTPDASDDSDKVIHKDLSNGFTKEAAIGFVSELEQEQQKIDDIMAEAKAKCQPHVDAIKAIKKAAATQGFEKKTFGASLSRRRHLLKAQSVTNSLNDEQKDKFSQIEMFLAEMPLGDGDDE